MKLKLVALEKISKEETYHIIGGQVNPDKKKKREKRKAERQKKKALRKERKTISSDTTDTLKNDHFKS